MVARMPSISRVALRRSLTRSTVSTRSATPRRAKNSVSSGMMTPWEAVRALMVSSPSEGWQSTRITSYSSSTGRSTRLRACSRATSLTSWTSAADRSMLAGTMSSPSTVVSWMTVRMSGRLATSRS